MPNTFEEANKATEELFTNDEQLSLADAEQPQTDGQATPQEDEANPTQDMESQENAPTEEEKTLDNAVKTVEEATNVALEKSQELEALKRQNEQLQGQNQQLQGTIDELSKTNEQTLVEEALKPPDPLNLNELAFADDETVRKAQEDRDAQFIEYAKKLIMKEVEPELTYAKELKLEKEKGEILSALSSIPELKGIQEMIPQLDYIIGKNKWLQSKDMPIEERYINAFAIAKGVNSVNAPPQAPQKGLTTEELMDLYKNNAEFQELVEKQRIEEIKQSQQVPPFSANSSAVNAALNIKEKPKDWNDASERTRKMFGA